MADVFISYARGDIAWVTHLAFALKDAGLTIWWDMNLHGGSHFPEETSKQLKACTCAVVVWSTLSITSEWVYSEADEARIAKKLIPVAKEPVRPPNPFPALHTIDLTRWDGGPERREIKLLIESINLRCGRATQSDAAAEQLRRPTRDERIRPRGQWLRRAGTNVSLWSQTFFRGVAQLRLPFVGWLALVAVVLLVGWSAVSFRDAIVTWVPALGSTYAAAGLPVAPRGMDFVDVAYNSETVDGQPVLAVTGAVVNRSDHELTVPLVRVSLYDMDHHELYHWAFVPGVASLKPGGRAKFRTRLSNPPMGTHNLEVRFVRSGE